MITSRIAELTGPGELVFKEAPLQPEQLTGREVLAETVVSAVSPGTELAAWRGDPPLRPMKVYPRVVGYCNVARVLYCGGEVSLCRPGDLILTHQSHRSAFICPENKIIARIDPEADLAAVSTTYLFHLGYAALMKGEVRAGHNVAVVGLGTLGLTTIGAAELLGARIFGFSGQRDAREKGLRLGASAVFGKDDPEPKPAIERLTDGVGIDVVVSTSNSWEDWRLALSLPRRGGVICVLGFPGRTEPAPDFNPLASQYFYDQQLTIHACGFMSEAEVSPFDVRFTLKRNCGYLMDMINRNRLAAKEIIAGRHAWDELPEVYRRMTDGPRPVGTVVLQWK